MPNKIQNIMKPLSVATRNHISKRVAHGMYDAKILLGASVAVDFYSKVVDYVQFGKNEKIDKQNKKYLQAYKLTNGVVEALVQISSGSILLNNNTQEYLLKVSRKITNMPLNPSKVVKNNFRILTTLFGSVLLAKRIITPLIVTPLTTYVRKNMYEDEEDIQELIEYNLIKNGYNTTVYSSGEEALENIFKTSPALILLDLMLPGIDGMDVCKKLKNSEKTNKVPIIMLTARGEEETIIKGFEYGVDDYVTKPFSPKILISRIKAVLRRKIDEKYDNNSIIMIHELSINPAKYEVLLNNTHLKLTNGEFKALHLLASQSGRVLTRYQIIDQIKGDDYEVTDRSVDVLMVGLRKKLDKCEHYIETVRGVGYRFKE